MNIRTKSSGLNNNSPINAKPVESVETAGSLANANPFSYFSVNVYDTFDSSNPFAGTINFSDYAGGSETIASASTGFMSGFASAVATVGTGCSSSPAVSCSSGGGFSGGGCSSGGFSSVG